tara:strand:+ start:107 stop:775 length:669 start_codon:yes stop_codon:yes gene_type:complete
MSNYFTQLPNLDYPSLLKTRQSNTDVVQTKNLFRRVKVREDLFANFMHFNQYKIIGDERPDNVADEVYDNDQLDWVILMSNNIVDVKNEWPMTQYDLSVYLSEKYTAGDLDKIHHYETVELRDKNNQLIVPAGKIVDENWYMEYLEGGILKRTNSLNQGEPIKSITFFEYENNLNDAKRNINVLKEEFLDLFLDNFKSIMKYQKSSQYINKKLKKTENIRIH